MFHHPNRLLAAMLAVSAGLAGGTATFADTPSFDQDIRPILAERCLHCHGGESPKNGLRLTTREGLLRGGKTGSAIEPGSLRDSLLWTFIATDKMPADGNKLSADQKGVLRRWILAGAPATAAEAARIDAAAPLKRSQISTEPGGVEQIAALIDRRIGERLKTAGVTASPRADDAEFLRRIYLDLAGRIPSYEETTAFLAADHPQKRRQLIDERLASPEFGRHQAILWHKLLIPKSAGAYPRIPHERFREWLADSFNSGRAWSEIVTDLLTAEGYLPSDKDNELTRKSDSKRQPQNVATAFLNAHNTEGRPQPKGIIASVSRLFLAQSIECAQCHNHPQAKWEQTDFWAAAAFFERVRYDKATYGDTSIGRLIEPATGGDLIYDEPAKGRYAFVPGVYPTVAINLEDANGQRTKQMIAARFLGSELAELDPEESPRRAFAAWATSRENPYFARAQVNRVWSQLFGRGFVEPVDDMSEDNRPSHPELLDELSAQFAAGNFDLKRLLAGICHSQTYQQASAPSAGDAPDRASAALFARQSLKQLTEDQLLASLSAAVPTFAKMLEKDAREKNPGLVRAAFLEVHETDDSLPTEHTRGLQQALRMMNGDGKLFNREALAGRVSAEATVDENIRRVYLQALCRNPSSQELARMRAFIATAADEIQRLDPRQLPQRKNDQPDNTPDPYADLLWVLINSGEFIFNH
ncbi:MAG: PSD1 and planctomycete cytochrome C domain-containing protein [Pirellulaceae bacterium]|nr:PSD1 and planctomycete cytochrome C domain-containing protein [Pirellulaceae bacterium]